MSEKFTIGAEQKAEQLDNRAAIYSKELVEAAKEIFGENTTYYLSGTVLDRKTHKEIESEFTDRDADELARRLPLISKKLLQMSESSSNENRGYYDGTLYIYLDENKVVPHGEKTLTIGGLSRRYSPENLNRLLATRIGTPTNASDVRELVKWLRAPFSMTEDKYLKGSPNLKWK